MRMHAVQCSRLKAVSLCLILFWRVLGVKKLFFGSGLIASVSGM
ncbi:hypothetical protein HMPREF1989_02244 [Porphyromonas gingivalis F0566]|nr:hypothetical protein HMPREF1989_02244 [Porphyromonas gingivalis F0566]